MHSLRDRLSYFHNLTSPNAWTGYFRGSPAAIKTEDAAVIEAALRSAAADPSRLLDLANLPMLTQRRRKRQLAAPVDEMPRPTEEDVSAISHPSRVVRVVETEEAALAKRLIQAATTSEDAAGFEVALAEAFAYLGFRTERRSGPGDTDVLAVAPLGEEAYAAVVDGKASRQGRVGNAQVDWFALERHKERHGADHILVVAPGFSGGELTRDAERTGAALLTASDLAEVLRLHAVAPFT
ncbi:MAG: restriction endonuclease, partial [Chloroflexota bacterium]|nr:restriction endonuclease [Chloroflexota bacterium]